MKYNDNAIFGQLQETSQQNVQSWGNLSKSNHNSSHISSTLRFLVFLNRPGLADKLLSIKSDLDPVVEEGKEGGEGEGGDEDGDEPELENHLEVLLEQALVVHQAVVQVNLGGAFPTCFWSKVLEVFRKSH